MNCHRSLERWDLVFEPHLRHGCLRAFILCLCCSVCRYQFCDGLIARLRSPSNCVKEQEIEKAAKVQQEDCRAMDRQTEQTDR
jgi:hypothetical protein